MTFVFGRCGQVRALDYTPFRRRIMHFVQRGVNPQTFQVQFHQLLQSPEQHRQISLPGLSTRGKDNFGMLPWKVSMLLLPATDFTMNLEKDQPPQESVLAKTSKPPEQLDIDG